MNGSTWREHFRAHLEVAGTGSLSIYEHLLQGHVPWPEHLSFVQGATQLPLLLPEFFRYQSVHAIHAAWTGNHFWSESFQLVGVWEDLPILAGVEPLPAESDAHILVLAHPTELEAWKKKLQTTQPPAAKPQLQALASPDPVAPPTPASASAESFDDRTVVGVIQEVNDIEFQPTVIGKMEPLSEANDGSDSDPLTNDATQIQPFRIPTHTTIQRFDLGTATPPPPPAVEDLLSEQEISFESADPYASEVESEDGEANAHERLTSDPLELDGLLPEGLFESSIRATAAKQEVSVPSQPDRDNEATLAIQLDTQLMRTEAIAPVIAPPPAPAAAKSSAPLTPPPLPTVKMGEPPPPMKVAPPTLAPPAFAEGSTALTPRKGSTSTEGARPSVSRCPGGSAKIFPLADTLLQNSDLQKQLEDLCQEICLLFHDVKILSLNEDESLGQETLSFKKGQSLQVIANAKENSEGALGVRDRNPLSLVLRTNKPYHGTINPEFKPSREAKALIGHQEVGNLTIIPLILHHKIRGFVTGLSEKQDIQHLHFLQKKTQEMISFIEPKVNAA